MVGDMENEIKRGITFRAVEHIFAQLEALEKYDWKFKVNVSFTEVYNE